MMPNERSQRLIGAHVSAAGGIDKAVERAAEIGANCLQVFSGSPRVWARSDINLLPLAKFKQKQAELSVAPVFTHSLYLINLASDNPQLVEKSLQVLKYDLQFDSLIGGSGIVVHLGSHQGRGWEEVREDVAKRLVDIFRQTPDDSTFLVENSAGQNGKLCSELKEIRWLFDRVGELAKVGNLKNIEQRLGWCFDTCHGHAAGYLLGDPNKVEDSARSGADAIQVKAGPLTLIEDSKKSVIEEINQYGLWERLRCIHVNDSRDPVGAGRDRHENIGDGLIPPGDLSFFLRLPQVLDLPLIIEVPGLKKDGPDAENIERLEKLTS
jgi:deoxyribonuclease IV